MRSVAARGGKLKKKDDEAHSALGCVGSDYSRYAEESRAEIKRFPAKSDRGASPTTLQKREKLGVNLTTQHHMLFLCMIAFCPSSLAC